MILVIAEKPSLARDIADALPGKAERKDGFIEKGDYIVTWLFGHMLTLKAPEDYNDIYKKWDLGTLPIYFDNWEQKVADDAEKKKKVKQIGEWLKKADTVIHAGDPDDEGQLLVDEILRMFKYPGTVKRLDTGNTTNAALRKALGKMTDNKLHENAGWSAYARSVADLMIGVNISRFFTCNNPGVLLTIGRVQTPTLGLVVARDYQIEHHIKSKYYNVLADVAVEDKVVQTRFTPAKDNPNLTDGRITDENYAKKIALWLNGKEFKNVKITKKTVKEAPPLPFNLVKLQSYCGKKYGYSPSDVLAITQNLREKYKAITYNRSDCQYLSNEHFKEAPETLKRVVSNIKYKPPGLDLRIKSRCFNDANITAHFAIIPTDQTVDISKLSEREKNVYMAIVQYYLIQFMPKAEKEKTGLEIDLDGKGNKLTATSTLVLNPGYLAILKEERPEEKSDLSKLAEGVFIGRIQKSELKEEETKPPARYTKSSLNEDMTRIAKYVDDPKIKQMLLDKDKDKKGENGSIGTSATRSSIIDKLVQRGYLKEEKKKLISTDLGRELCRILPKELTLPNMTAEWWVIQEEITAGTKQHKDLTENVLDGIKVMIGRTYPRVDNKIIAAKKTKNVLGKCPRCGGDILEGDKGFYCSNWKAETPCKFGVFKKSKLPLFSKSTFTATMMKKFLSGKPVHMTKLYSPKKEKTFEADVVMTDDPSSAFGPKFELVFKSYPKKGDKKT